MKPTRQILRPPRVGDLWYVKLHHSNCSAELDAAQVMEMTECTVLLKISRNEYGEPERTSRYMNSDVLFVEFVREMPRSLETPSCPTRSVTALR